MEVLVRQLDSVTKQSGEYSSEILKLKDLLETKNQALDEKEELCEILRKDIDEMKDLVEREVSNRKLETEWEYASKEIEKRDLEIVGLKQIVSVVAEAAGDDAIILGDQLIKVNKQLQAIKSEAKQQRDDDGAMGNSWRDRFEKNKRNMIERSKMIVELENEKEELESRLKDKMRASREKREAVSVVSEEPGNSSHRLGELRRRLEEVKRRA